MTTVFRPNLASPADFGILRFPLLASYKLDGIRALVRDGVLLSRSGKPIPNQALQTKFGHLEGYDGELIYGPPNAKDVFNSSTRAVMTQAGPQDVDFYTFDHIEQPQLPYIARVDYLQDFPGVVILKQYWITSLENLQQFEELALAQGYEGVMVRDPNARYKNGRSTAREQGLLKVKRFVDFEAIIIGANELERNKNETFTNELGLTSRSHAQAGKVGAGTLGSLTLQRVDGVVFEVGTGFTQSDRDDLWANRGSIIGRIVTVKSFPIGEKDKPRMPVFKGFRNKGEL